MNNPPLILLIDDESQIRDLYAAKLSGEGYEVVQAVNGMSGYETAKEKQPDLILLDMRMPVMDGAETIMKLKEDEATQNIPVIFLTALSDDYGEHVESDVKAAKEVGAVDYIKKGVDLSELVEKVKAHLPQAEAPSEPAAE